MLQNTCDLSSSSTSKLSHTYRPIQTFIRYSLIQVSQAVTKDFPDLSLPTGLEIIAGLLYVPLSSGGKDFIAFLRKGQLREVHWAGKPFKDEPEENSTSLEPRKSFKVSYISISREKRAQFIPTAVVRDNPWSMSGLD